MGIQADLYISGTHPKRRAPKNYANPRYKCVLISDMDPIGDKKVIEAPASKYPILEPPIPYIIPLFPHLGAGGPIAHGYPAGEPVS